MNGNWYPWSSGSTPQQFVAAWIHVHGIFSSKGLNSTSVQWIWCVNNVDVGSHRAEDYWVGENYADWLGIDGYNFGTSQSWGSWLSPSQVFDNMIQRLKTISSSKPICINEYASTSAFVNNISNIATKNNWLTDFCIYMDTQSIKMASYFNTDKETDWAIFRGSFGNSVWNNLTAYTAYKDCFNTSFWIVSNSTNTRILTNEQFSGKSIALCF